MVWKQKTWRNGLYFKYPIYFFYHNAVVIFKQCHTLHISNWSTLHLFLSACKYFSFVHIELSCLASALWQHDHQGWELITSHHITDTESIFIINKYLTRRRRYILSNAKRFYMDSYFPHQPPPPVMLRLLVRTVEVDTESKQGDDTWDTGMHLCQAKIVNSTVEYETVKLSL